LLYADCPLSVLRESQSFLRKSHENEEGNTMKTARFIKPLTITFTKEAYDRVKEISDTRSISMGEWIRETVDNGLRLASPNQNRIPEDANLSDKCVDPEAEPGGTRPEGIRLSKSSGADKLAP
jgi:hypothetical protein